MLNPQERTATLLTIYNRKENRHVVGKEIYIIYSVQGVDTASSADSLVMMRSSVCLPI